MVNWKRGLFRGWVGATILWVAYTLYAFSSGDWRSDNQGFAILFGPPIVALIIGLVAFYGGCWIEKDFRPSIAPTGIEKKPSALQQSETGHAHLSEPLKSAASERGTDKSGIRPELKGIGGWLLLLAIGQVVSTILAPLLMLRNFSQYPGLWTLPELRAAIVVEIFISVFVTMYVLYTTSMMFQSRSAFPRLYRYEWVVVGLSPVLSLACFALVTGHFPARGLLTPLTTSVSTLIAGAIWSLYTLKSVRVRNTFIT